jgi:membrane-associated phospholipid phosphatase
MTTLHDSKKKYRFNIFCWLFLMTLIFSSSSSYAQTTEFTNYSYKPDKKYIFSYFKVGKKIVTSPLKWEKNQWIIAGSVLAVGTAIYVFDDEIRKAFQNNKNNFLDNTSRYLLEPWGGGLYPAILFGGYYLHGLTTNNKKSRQIALGGTQVFVLAAVSSQIIKHVFHRHRPTQDHPPNPRLWEGPFSGWQYTAFPSGHTTTAFAIASYMSSVYKGRLWVGVLTYGIATGVGLSRVYDNVHWPSDVLFGAVLGFAIGKSVYNFMSEDSAFSIGISDTGGISLAYRIK